MQTKDTTDVRDALAACEGFAVHGPKSQIGTVEGVRVNPGSGCPALLSVRAGVNETWLVHVPVAEVESVDLDEGRIVLRAGALLAGPRTARGTLEV